MGRLADDIYAHLGPFAEDDLTGELREFVESLLEPLEDLADILAESDDHVPWEIALDVDEAPASTLPWLAQWVGVRFDEDDTEDTRREKIRMPDGFARGTRAALHSTVQRTLTGTRRVVIRERTPEAYDLYVRTIIGETPDQSATLAAILRQKPAGLVLDYDAVSALSYIDLDAEHDDYDALAATFADYDEISETTP